MNTLDPIKLISAWTTNVKVGGHCKLSNDVIVFRDGDDRWRIGHPTEYSSEIRELVATVSGDAVEVAGLVVVLSPSTVDFFVASEESRQRYIAESNERDRCNYERCCVYYDRMMAAMRVAMEKAGCTCQFLMKIDCSPSMYGNYDGITVYADSAAGAKRVADWLVRWEEADYASRGGTYGGSYGQAQHVYRVEVKEPPSGLGGLAFANFRYYSIGD